MFAIREAKIEDAAAIRHLSCQELGYDCPQEQTEKTLEKLLNRKDHRIFVAEDGDKIIGYAHACDYELLYWAPLKNLMGIAVSGQYKRQGVGRELLSAVEQWAKSTGAAGVRVNSGATRLGAHAFYHSCGYGGDKEQLNLKKSF